MKTYKKIQIKIAGNDNLNSEEVRKTFDSFFDFIFIKKQFPRYEKNILENKLVGLRSGLLNNKS